MANGGKDDVGGVTLTPLEMAAAEVSVGLHVTDHRLDGGAAPELAFDHAEDATLLAGNEDAARVCGFVAAIALVDIGPLDRTAGEPLGGFDDLAEREPYRAGTFEKSAPRPSAIVGCAIIASRKPV